MAQKSQGDYTAGQRRVCESFTALYEASAAICAAKGDRLSEKAYLYLAKQAKEIGEKGRTYVDDLLTQRKAQLETLQKAQGDY